MTSSTPLNKRSVSRSLSLLPRRLFHHPLPRSACSPFPLLEPLSSLSRPPAVPVALHLPRSTRAGMQRRAVSRTQRPDCRTPGEICQSPPITGISLPSLHFYAVFARRVHGATGWTREGGEHGGNGTTRGGTEGRR